MSRPRLHRLVLAFGAAAVFLVLAGATVQGVLTALERRRLPYPGRLVDVGSHQLHIDCQGRGTPTVVLEAPAVVPSAAWYLVQREVARTTRVCAYDRAGLGWSEAGDAGFVLASVTTDLRTLLDNAGEAPPFIAVGAELGAAFAEHFAARYPDDVAALVLVDPPDPATTGPTALDATRSSPWLARIGALRLLRRVERQPPTDLPPQQDAAVKAFMSRPDHLTRAAAELAHWHEAVTLDPQQIRRELPVYQVLYDGSTTFAHLTLTRNARDISRTVGQAVQRISRQP
jgi:pimeloyl-ACP methyl ester carboxylesterase